MPTQTKSPRVWDQDLGVPLTITRQNFIGFSFVDPVSTNVSSIVLRNPSFGNTFSDLYERILNETRGKVLFIGGNSTYSSKPKIRTLAMDIENMTQLSGQQLMTFINASLGNLVTFNDYEGMVYSGLITNPDIELIQKDIVNYSVHLEFEILTGYTG